MLIRLLCLSGLLACVAKVSDHTKCISLSNQPCITKSARINPGEPCQWLLSNPILVSFNRCNGSFNTFDDLSSKRCIQNRTKYINLKLFHNHNKRIKRLTKHTFSVSKCKFNGKKCYSNQKWKNYRCESRNTRKRQVSTLYLYS